MDCPLIRDIVYPNWKSTTMILLSLNHIMMPIFHITYFVNYYIMLCYAMAFHSILNYLTCYQTLFIAVQCVTWYLFAYVVRCYVIIVLYLCRILVSCINPYLQFCYVVAICSILCDIVLYCDTLLYIYILLLCLFHCIIYLVIMLSYPVFYITGRFFRFEPTPEGFSVGVSPGERLPPHRRHQLNENCLGRT